LSPHLGGEKAKGLYTLTPKYNSGELKMAQVKARAKSGPSKKASGKQYKTDEAKIDRAIKDGRSYDSGTAYISNNGGNEFGKYNRPYSAKASKGPKKAKVMSELEVKLEAEQVLAQQKREADRESYFHATDAFTEETEGFRELARQYRALEAPSHDADMSPIYETQADINARTKPAKKLSKKQMEAQLALAEKYDNLIEQLATIPHRTQGIDVAHKLIMEIQKADGALEPFMREYARIHRQAQSVMGDTYVENNPNKGSTLEEMFALGCQMVVDLTIGELVTSTWTGQGMKSLTKGDEAIIIMHGYDQNSGASREAMKVAASHGLKPLAFSWDYKSGPEHGAKVLKDWINKVYERTNAKVRLIPHSSGADAARIALLSPGVAAKTYRPILSQGGPNAELTAKGPLKYMNVRDDEFASTQAGRERAIKSHEYVGDTRTFIGTAFGSGKGANDFFVSYNSAVDTVGLNYTSAVSHFHAAGGHPETVEAQLKLIDMPRPKHIEIGEIQSNSRDYWHMTARPSIESSPVVTNLNTSRDYKRAA